MKRSIVLAVLLLLIPVLAACGSVPPRNPLPEEYGETAEIPGIPRARHWGDVAPPISRSVLALPPEEIRKRFAGIMGREHHYLALSGGGDDGAFGAGLLTGWTEAGTRPEFTLVTGVSTGALMAPFAFLGSEYDHLLKTYTQVSAEDVLDRRTVLQTVTSDAAASSAPLAALIAKFVDDKLLAAVAAEHKRGRRLYLGTTNLDAGRPVIWDMGVIASSGAPNALELFRSVMLASASIPAAFPPILIEVEADGKRYDEIHVDGGTTTQVFLMPIGLDMRRVQEVLDVKGAPKLYVVRNSRLAPVWKTIEASFAAISGRAVSSLIRTQGIGDLYRLYLEAEEGGMEFRLACISADFELEPTKLFDKAYMSALFEHARETAKQGYPWVRNPPGMDD